MALRVWQLNKRFKKMHADFIVSSVLMFCMGLIVLIWSSEEDTALFGRAMGMSLIAMSSFFAVGFNMDGIKRDVCIPIAGLIIFLSGSMVIEPNTSLVTFPLCVGGMVLYQGIRQIAIAVKSRKYHNENWGVTFGFAPVSIIFGLVYPCQLFMDFEIPHFVVALVLLFTGPTCIWVTNEANKAARRFVEENYTPIADF